ncbi:MAG: transketolase [Candidatus Limnocylindrales bacterium]|jgi:transketolase
MTSTEPRAAGGAAGGRSAADRAAAAEAERLLARAETEFPRYEVVKDLVDELIDLQLDYRQSGHPGGSRSKVHLLLGLLLSGAMRWDIRRPWLRYGDRFVLSAGHTVPLVYATLAVLNEAVRARFERTGDPRFAFPEDGRFALTWENLSGLRHRGGLPGHAEMAGKTLFFKANTGPSGHGMPFAAGEALALKLAGAGEVRVFVVEGEGGLTPGAAHETKNSAWGLGLSNLVFLVDWNDFGIDERPASSVVHGTPVDWFEPYGWRVTGAERGMEWDSVIPAVVDAARGPNPAGVPSMAWFRTRKGRGYGKFDAASHGSPHKQHAPEFWAVRREFMARYGVAYQGVGEAAPADAAARAAEATANFRTAIDVLRRDVGLVDWLSDRLLEIAGSVPEEIEGARVGRKPPAEAASANAIPVDVAGPIGGIVPSLGRFGSNPISPACDHRIFEFERYPAEMWRAPGELQPNRAGLATWGSYVNAIAKRDYGRPLFIACSADLAESTNIAGFAKPFGDLPGFGWYERDSNPTGSLLPTEITEFANSGMMAGLASVNLAADPFTDFDGLWGATSTYGSFSYLVYGPLRLFSQLAQDCDLRVGKVLYVAGHSGPETAEDSRTHFGVFAPGVTQLFPEGHVIDLHPWEYNEVPVVLAAACATSVPIIALHLTRPAVAVPDRAALGMPGHFAAARGAYVMRPFRDDAPKAGTVFVRGSLSTANLVKVLPELDRRGLNVKVVAAISPQLFALQDEGYRSATIEPADRLDSMVITNGAYKLMRDWADDPIVREYSLSSDWDDRWRTGGSVDEVIEEAHLDSGHILAGIERFVRERPARLRGLHDRLDAAERR